MLNTGGGSVFVQTPNETLSGLLIHFLQRPAKALYACDNASCSTTCTVCCTNKQKRCKRQCFGHGRQIHGCL